MGCGISRPSPRGAAAANPSSSTSAARSRGAAQVSTSQPASSIDLTSPQATTHPTPPANSTALRASKPWRATTRQWNPSLLARERQIFWDTQVSGRREIWAAIELATNMVRNEGDLTGAKAVLDASGCTCPTGRLSDGIWDERGVLYKMPRWVVSDPVNVAADPEEEEDEDAVVDGDDEDDDVVAKEANSEHSTDEKGKARVPTGADALTVRTRLSDRGTDVVVTLDKEQNVRTLIRRVQAEAGIPSHTKVKMAYMGKMLKDGETLTKQGWQVGHVLNAMVFQM